MYHLLKELEQIQIDVSEGRKPKVGICALIDVDNLGNEEEGIYKEVLEEIWKEWPDFSGNLMYPVPDPANKYIPQDAYDKYESKWEGPYGNKRWELLMFTIQKLKEGYV
jgi:hypothetical protein